MVKRHALLSPHEVSPQEPVARYLSQSGHFSQEKRRVKPHAFLPEPSRLATSVFRTHRLTESEIWALGETYVAGPTGRTLHGRADLLVSQVETLGLRLNPDNVPERHAEIVGWPQAKSEQLSLAQELAVVALLRLRP